MVQKSAFYARVRIIRTQEWNKRITARGEIRERLCFVRLEILNLH